MKYKTLIAGTLIGYFALSNGCSSTNFFNNIFQNDSNIVETVKYSKKNVKPANQKIISSKILEKNSHFLSLNSSAFKNPNDLYKKINLPLFIPSSEFTEKDLSKTLEINILKDNSKSLYSKVLNISNYDCYTKDSSIVLKNNLDDESLDEKIIEYAREDLFFRDNNFYKRLRYEQLEKEYEKYDLNEKFIAIDKTFQKLMIVEVQKLARIVKKVHADSVTYAGKQVIELENNSENVIELFNSPKILFEYDCSTAKEHGKKKYNGDGKTPEGLLYINSIEQSHNKTFEGKKAYGPYFNRIYHGIGIHGNGTDTTKVKNWKNDLAYKTPGLLGIFDNNFGYGLSHGCIRLDNSDLRYIVEHHLVEKMPVIIYENYELTKKLSAHYGGRKWDSSIF